MSNLSLTKTSRFMIERLEERIAPSTCGIIEPVDDTANEGVGNGVDGNTPGHLKNNKNDDPQYSPGNPGAKNK